MSDAPFISIPDDPEECRERLFESLIRVGELGRRNDELSRILDATAADYDALQQRYAEQADLLALYRRFIFGPRRERVADDPGQGHLFDLPEARVEPDAAVAPEPDEPASKEPRRATKPRPSRSLDHLPHVRIEHDLTEAEKTCPCCGGMKRKIGEDVSRELEFIPAQFEVREHVLPKYACPKCKGGVAAPPVPPKPTPGGMAGAGLVSFVVVSKFADHLPLYRLEDILFRHGVSLSRSTLCDWVRDAADLLKPLADIQRERLLQTDLIWTDDTHVLALGGEKPGSTKATFWTYIGGAAAPYSVYDFTMSRERNGPATFLKDFRGYLQADAYGGYDGIYIGSDGTIMEVACWAHARRKFFEARSNAPAEANRVLEWIRQLYDVEDRARDLTAEDRRALRQRESAPILDKIEAYIDEVKPRALPKSALGKALTYAMNQRAALRRYVDDGRLTIDNNVSERTLRLQAIGRKNWLFLGSEAAGPRAAVLFTILAGAKRHRLEPWAYLREVLLRLAVGEADLESLLPDRWAAAHPEQVLEYRLEESRQKAARRKAVRDRRRAGRPSRE